MPFAEEFIEAFMAGQQARQNKQDYQRRQRQMVFEDEDREIEKEMLQHRLKEMKINQRLQARQTAAQNLELLSGIPMNEVTPEMTEGGVLPARSATGDDSIQTLLKEIDIPGIEELGVAGIKRRPQTLETQLGELMAKARIKEMTEIRPVSRGGVLTQGGREIYRNPYTSPAQAISKVDRDAQGVETQTWITPEQALGGATATRSPLPQRTGGGTGASVLSSEDRNLNADAIVAGRGLPEVPNTTEGLRLKAELERRGFNLARANQDLRAMRAHFQTLNGEGQSRMRVAAEIADSALTELEDAQAAWQAGGRGVLSRGRLSLALTGGLGPEAKQEAAAFKSALEEVQQAIALLKSGGSQANNRALEQAEADLNSGSNIPATIKRLRSSLQYRVAAIRNLEAITPSSLAGPDLGGGGAADDPLGILGR